MEASLFGQSNPPGRLWQNIYAQEQQKRWDEGAAWQRRVCQLARLERGQGQQSASAQVQHWSGALYTVQCTLYSVHSQDTVHSSVQDEITLETPTALSDREKAWAVESETMVPNCELGQMKFAKVLFEGEGQVHSAMWLVVNIAPVTGIKPTSLLTWKVERLKFS